MSPLKSDATKRIKNRKNRILAIPAEAAATPPKPNTAATNATTRKISVQRNIGDLPIPKSIFTRKHNSGTRPWWLVPVNLAIHALAYFGRLKHLSSGND
jgi:hypothetical protein